MRVVGVAALALALMIVGGPAVAQTPSLGQVFKRVNPSVVIVRTKEKETGTTGLGSGVLVSADGKVLSAAHVVHTADEISVEFLNGETVGARVVASEPYADVSLLQLEHVPPGALVARLGDSDLMEVGEQVFVIGAPYGIGHTLTVGHLSGRHKPNTVYSAMGLAEFFQTDAAINQGNSGGPMFDMRGEVIGVVSHVISKSGGFEGLGFVVTSNTTRRLLLERRSFWSGLEGVLLTGELAQALNVAQGIGLLVQRVAEQSPAAAIGLRPGTLRATIDGRNLTVGGDIILKVQGVPIAGDLAGYEQMQERLSRLARGATVTLTVLRSGKEVELSAPMP
jgi:S1-C subfamily serine protease